MVSHFKYIDAELYCENVPVEKIADAVGTPAYIYSRNAFIERYTEIHDAFSVVDHTTCYSVKTNANLSLLSTLAKQGCGFDIVSGGELFRVIQAGGDPSRTVFAGVGKTVAEIRAALDAGILMFNVESEAELQRIDSVAGEMGVKASIAFRVNPDVDPKTHKYTATGKAESKFGMDFERSQRAFESLKDFPNVTLKGLHVHLGSPLYTVDPYGEALDKIIGWVEKAGIQIEYMNTGGGFGIDYKPNQSAVASDYAKEIVPRIQKMGVKLILEPGRYISGNSGILVSEVQYVKDSGPKRFWITDGAMNDLIRPALYESFHEIWPVKASTPPPLLGGSVNESDHAVDVVGPVCESSDFFAKDRKMPDAVQGDRIAVFSAGAYGSVMGSRYNQRPLPVEVVVDGNDFHVTRSRETYDDMMAMESIPDGW